jgi:transposase InsO family protein
VFIGDGKWIPANGCGTVYINPLLSLRDVWYCPRISRRLVSTRQLGKAGFLTQFGLEGGTGLILKVATQAVIARHREGPDGLSYLQDDIDSHQGLPAQAFDDKLVAELQKALRLSETVIWHHRFGHLNYNSLRRLLNMTLGMPKQLPQPPQGVCRTCVEGKHQISRDQTPQARSTVPIEFIHSDLSRIMPASLGWFRYYIIFVDDCTRYTWIYFLYTKTAAEIIKVFKNFKTHVEKQYNRQMKRFRCDNGTGEYNNDTFRGFLVEQGITYEPSPPHQQQMNGVAERMMRTLKDMARCMLRQAGLPDAFWAEAMNTAVYLRARCPTSAVDNGTKTPFEKLRGQKPDVHHLRAFGCRAYKHEAPAQREKSIFASKTRACINIGLIDETTSIWKLWDPASKRAMTSGSVVFDETLSQASTPGTSQAARLPTTRRTQRRVSQHQIC